MRVGRLSALTQLNIDLLLRVRDDVDEHLRANIRPATYDKTIRFNITLIDNDLCITQPYLPAMRGLDSPTLVIQRRDEQPGLFHTFEQVFSWVTERSTPL